NGLKKDLVKLGVLENKILVAPDGVDLKEFGNINESKENLRKRLNLPLDKKIVLYAGHLYRWKGAHILAKAISRLSNDYLAVFVGGTDEDIKKFKEFIKENNLQNILLLGYQKPSIVPYYLKSADILILPNSGREKISSHYTSPMKLFEYMASGVPIVASDLPSIKEILNKNNALFFDSDNIESLTEKIKFVLQNKEFSGKISKQSKNDVVEYTWRKRAKTIDFFAK
ncbi:glycosyltransferase, partial [Candidatus Falkowbacteria bacterium]|nr:glycosyltransferase [Candidatus Falkowbacteria bacterium]